MVRITIVLLLTVTTVQAGETTLACEGTQTPFIKYGKPQPIVTTLIVDVADESVTWEGNRAVLDPGHRQKHTLHFKWKHDESCDDTTPAPVRTLGDEASCGSYSFTGTLNRASGMASIIYTHYIFASAENAASPDTVKYELRCEPARPLF